MLLRIQIIYMNKVILDANFIVAIIDEKDASHKKASHIKIELSQINPKLIFLDCVINEVVSVFVKRLSERKQIDLLSEHIRKLNDLIPKEKITWTYPEIEDYYESIVQMVEKSKGRLNFHDAFIVLLANDYEIRHIVSFDKGFDETGLKRIKDAGDI